MVNLAPYPQDDSGIGYLFIKDFKNHDLRGMFQLKPWQWKNMVH